eukprot:SAG22_NODE_10_length_35702_cov_72.266992_21_plen_678_part_00
MDAPEGTEAPQRPAREALTAFNWDLVYYLTEAFGWICSAWFAILMWLRIAGVLHHGWRFVFQPLAINFGASTMITIFGLGKAICSLNMRWPSNFDNHELIHRLLLWRNLCECGYKVVQNIGLYIVVCRLPSYVDDAYERKVRLGPAHEGFAMGTNIDAGAPVPISVIIAPLWVAWAVELVIYAVFERVKTVQFVRRGQLMTARFPQPLRGHLHSILRKVVIRPFARTFAYNLHLTLVARMIAGSYSFSWGVVFIAAWIHYGLLGIFLLYLAFLGVFCTMFDCVHGTQRGKVYLRTLLAAFGGVWILTVSVASIICNFLFFLMLAMRLDGNAAITIGSITVPLILHYCFSALLGPARYYVGQRELNADESVVAMVDLQTSEEQEMQRITDEWEAARAGYVPPVTLFQLSTTLYRTPTAVTGLGGDDAGGGGTGGGEAGGGGDIEAGSATARQFKRPGSALGAAFDECAVCYEQNGDAVLLPCGHGGLCRTCADQIAARQYCHLCRARVLRVALLSDAGLDVETGNRCFHVMPQPPSPLIRPPTLEAAWTTEAAAPADDTLSLPGSAMAVGGLGPRVGREHAGGGGGGGGGGGVAEPPAAIGVEAAAQVRNGDGGGDVETGWTASSRFPVAAAAAPPPPPPPLPTAAEVDMAVTETADDDLEQFDLGQAVVASRGHQQP